MIFFQYFAASLSKKCAENKFALICAGNTVTLEHALIHYGVGNAPEGGTSRSLFCVSPGQKMSWVMAWVKLMPQNQTIRKSTESKNKATEIQQISVALVRPKGFEPPAFWSVACLRV